MQGQRQGRKQEGTNYRQDRSYTDQVHRELACKLVYPKMGWTECPVADKDMAVWLDNTQAVDYQAIDRANQKISIQERFRKPGMAKYDDLTLRYERPESHLPTERKSEFYKIQRHVAQSNEPFCLLYGIPLSDMSDFAKVCVIDLRAICWYYDQGCIVIDNDRTGTSFFRDGVLHAAVNHNRDRSSDFVVFSIADLMQLPNVIVYQDGFVTEKHGGRKDSATEKQISYLQNLAFRNGFTLSDIEAITTREASELIDFLKSHDDVEKVRQVMSLLAYGTIVNHLHLR